MSLQLFDTTIPVQPVIGSVEESDLKFKQAVQSIVVNVLEQGYIPVCNSSYGKDSVVTLMAAIEAVKQFYARTGVKVKLIVATALLTGMESPVVDPYVQGQTQRLKQYAKDNALEIEVLAVTPTFDENYLLQILGGKTVMVFGKGKAKCSIDSKQAPIKRMVKNLTSESYVTLLGTRFEESKIRGADMRQRNEDFNVVTVDDSGRKTMPPIATMTDSEVFEIIRKAAWNQMGVSVYSDYDCPVDADAVIELYSTSSEHSCSTQAFISGTAHESDFDAGGACDKSENLEGRFGCWMCGRVQRDKKHEQISKKPGFEWLNKFLDVREALMATEYNYDVRTWLNKRVDKEGHLNITLGSYSPEFCEKALKWVLTLRAETGYMTVSDDELLWLMVQWMRYGFPNPFEIINIRNAIILGGERYYPSDDDKRHHPKKSVPKAIKVKVADSVFGDAQYSYKRFVGEEENQGWTTDFVSQHDATAFFDYHWNTEKYDVRTKSYLSQQTHDFSAIHKLEPVAQFQMLTSILSAHRKDGKYYEFTPRRGAKSHDMFQRASLLHRLGLKDKLADKDYLIERFAEDEGFELVA